MLQGFATSFSWINSSNIIKLTFEKVFSKLLQPPRIYYNLHKASIEVFEVIKKNIDI